jgi:pyridoxal phosphate enzyme (YggS family)
MSHDELCDRIAGNLRDVRDRISQAAQRGGRDPGEVTIVAITKSFPPEVIRAAVEVGLDDIGENRVQEMRDKREWLQDLEGVRWHLVGHLQRNKVHLALSLFDILHSLDSLRLARTVERRAAAVDQVVPLFLEVNVSGEASKYGFLLDDDEAGFFSTVEEIIALPHLQLDGLMTVPPLVPDPEEVRPIFRRLRDLRKRLRNRFPTAPWTHLSMGMTDDYPVAVEEGATMVRLGRALFGARSR